MCRFLRTVIGPRLFKIRAAIARIGFAVREAGDRPDGPGADLEPAQQARQLTRGERVGLALIVWTAPGVPVPNLCSRSASTNAFFEMRSNGTVRMSCSI